MSAGEFLDSLDGRLSYRIFDDWLRTGKIHLAQDANGSGSRREVSDIEAAAICDLLDAKELADRTLREIQSGAFFAKRLEHHRILADVYRKQTERSQ